MSGEVPLYLVTGASGFLGRALALRLAKAGSVLGTDSSKHGAEAVIVADLRDRTAIAELVADARPSCIVHCGAISGPMLARGEPALILDVNVGGTINVMEALGDAIQ